MQRSPILQICQDAADELSLARPATLFPDTGAEADTDHRKLLRALTKACQFLAANHPWQILRAEHVITTVASEEQTSAIPTDFLRFVPETMHNRTRRLRHSGPVSPKQWQDMKMWGIAAAPGYFRQMHETLLFFPAPAAGEIIAYEYIRDAIGTVGDVTDGWTSIDAGWVSIDENEPDTTSVKRWSADTNRPLWDDELMISGIVAHFRKMEGLDHGEQWRHFMQIYADRVAMDGHSRVLDMSGSSNALSDRLRQLRNTAGYVGGEVPGSGYSVP
jgi:hypothetical protein